MRVWSIVLPVELLIVVHRPLDEAQCLLQAHNKQALSSSTVSFLNEAFILTLLSARPIHQPYSKNNKTILLLV